MKQIIKIPSLGDAENTEVIEICVNPGDSVGSDDSIVVLESEKAAMDVPASKQGVVKKVLVKIGDEVKEGDDFLEIEVSEEVIKEKKSDQNKKDDLQHDEASKEEVVVEQAVVKEDVVQESDESQEYKTSKSGIYAGPAVRKLAREFGINLNEVLASGPRNRILKEDLHKFVKSKLKDSSSGIPKMPSIDFSEFGDVEEIDLTKFQKTSALNLQQSWITIPHVTQHDETSIDELLELRKSLIKKYKTKVSPLAFFAKGICRLLEEFPMFNASIDALNIGNSSSNLHIPFAKNANGETFVLYFLISDFLSSNSSSIDVSSCCVTWGIVIHDCWRFKADVFWNFVRSISSTSPNSEKSILGIFGIPDEESLSLDFTNLWRSSLSILFLGPEAKTSFKFMPNSLANFLTAGPA